MTTRYVHNTLPGQLDQMIEIKVDGLWRWANAYHKGQYHLVSFADDCSSWIDKDSVEAIRYFVTYRRWK